MRTDRKGRAADRAARGPRRRVTRWLAAAAGAVALAAGVLVALPATAAASQWLAVATGGWHTCGVKTDRSLWCWGFNGYGQLGTGNSTNRTSPTRVGTATTWTAVTAGLHHTCALQTNGARWCWGLNDTGQLGLGNTTSRNTPGGGDTGWTSLSAGGKHTCGVRGGGGAQCWGFNLYGALGVGDSANRLSPTAVSGGHV